MSTPPPCCCVSWTVCGESSGTFVVTVSVSSYVDGASAASCGIAAAVTVMVCDSVGARMPVAGSTEKGERAPFVIDASQVNFAFVLFLRTNCCVRGPCPHATNPKPTDDVDTATGSTEASRNGRSSMPSSEAHALTDADTTTAHAAT